MTPRVRYTVGTLALLAVAFGYTLSQGRTHASPPRPPARAVALPRPPAPPPSARDLLARAGSLHLDAAQRARLAALDAQWTEESAGLETALAAASAELSRYMDEHRGARVALDELQRRSEDVRELGASLRLRRERHGAAAAAVLTEVQRREPGPEPQGGTR